MRKQHSETWHYAKWHLSPTYYRTLIKLQSTDDYPKAYWEKWQFTTLKKVLLHAYEKVPYYRDCFKAKKFNPNTMRSIEEFHDYPFLDKKIFQINSQRFIAEGEQHHRLMHAFTGGTTGEPIPLIRYWHDLSREKAFYTYAYRMLGIDPGCKKVIIRGPADDNNGRFFYRTEFGRTLRLSSLNLCDENLALYIEQIRLFRPRLMVATPSIVILLCQYMQRHGIPHFESLEWANTPSENLYLNQKEYIEKILQCRVLNSYGQSEHIVSAVQCRHSEFYHVLPQYGYTELIGKDGQPVTEEGQIGEIVGTAFTNKCCPLIRYRTKDYALFTKEKCPCQRDFVMLKKVIGRLPAIAWSRQSAPVSVGPELLCTVFDQIYARIRQFHIEQRVKGKLCIQVFPFDDRDMPDIVAYFKNLFRRSYPNCFDITVYQKHDINFTSSGKSQFFIQHLSIDGS